VKFKIEPGYQALKDLAMRVPEMDPDAVAAYLQILGVTSELTSAMDVHYARHGLSRGRFRVLITLFHNQAGPVGAAEIADVIGVTRATMTGLLDGLERDGFIRRDGSSDDRRMLNIGLTAKGRRFLEKMLPEHFRRTAALMSGLDKKEKKQLVCLLEKVRGGTHFVREP
jgi:DNA-binding MarR family transcriptional regulator